jgi:hypothetical protein
MFKRWHKGEKKKEKDEQPGNHPDWQKELKQLRKELKGAMKENRRPVLDETKYKHLKPQLIEKEIRETLKPKEADKLRTFHLYPDLTELIEVDTNTPLMYPPLSRLPTSKNLSYILNVKLQAERDKQLEKQRMEIEELKMQLEYERQQKLMVSLGSI